MLFDGHLVEERMGFRILIVKRNGLIWSFIFKEEGKEKI